MIEYQNKNTFYAKGYYHFEREAIPVQLSGSYKSYSSDAVEIYVWSEDKNASKIFDSSMSFPYNVWFEGTTERGESIWMMGIKPKQIINFNHLEGTVGVCIKGDIKTIVKPGEKIYIHAKISPTPVISPEWMYSLSYDGTISRAGAGDEKERKGIVWINEHGKFTLIDNYEYVNGDENNNNVLLRIRTNSLSLTICPDMETELRALLLQLPKFLFEDLNLLSFIGRKRIVCIEASANIKTDKKSSSAFARYQTWGGFYNLPSDQSFLRSLIRPLSLQQGMFEHLATKYKQSPYKAVIDRTIPYLISSYEDGYVETHLINAYAALESIVDGIGSMSNQNYLLGADPFKKLSEKIKDLVYEEITDVNIADGVIKKLPELRRRSLLDRLLFLLKTHNVNTSLIWPPDTNEPEELHKILKRRNTLIHTGVLEQGDIWSFDLNRIQKLVELWILNLLECPDDAINEYSLWQGAPINQILHY